MSTLTENIGYIRIWLLKLEHGNVDGRVHHWGKNHYSNEKYILEDNVKSQFSNLYFEVAWIKFIYYVFLPAEQL